MQCFHYLLPRGEYSHLCGGARDPQEADPRVEELCRVMQHIDEAMQSVLDPKKTKVNKFLNFLFLVFFVTYIFFAIRIHRKIRVSFFSTYSKDLAI